MKHTRFISNVSHVLLYMRNIIKKFTQPALELEVSRTKIYNKIEKLVMSTKRTDKNNFIEDYEFDKIKEVIKNEIGETVKTSETNETIQERLRDILDRDRNNLYNNVSDREYTDLNERISFLEAQMETKDRQIMVRDEQIHVKDNQINGLIQSNLNFAKALNPPLDGVAATVEVKKGFFNRLFNR